MKKIIAGVFLVLLAVAPALATPKIYIEGTGGFSKLNQMDIDPDFGNSFDLNPGSGYLASGAIGLQFDSLRAALEFTHQKSKAKNVSDGIETLETDGNVQVNRYMASVYKDFKTTTYFTPFIGVGVGVANISINDHSGEGSPFVVIDDSDNVLAGKAEAGMSMEITKNISLLASYEYFMTDDADLQTTALFGSEQFDTAVDAHNFKFGARYRF